MTANTQDAPALIALDWGTSSLRAYLMTASGAVLETRVTGHGIQALPQPGLAGFEAAFAGLCADWLATHGKCPVVACGMVGSAQGWREAPYVGCPADIDRLAGQAVTVNTALGVPIRIAPGILYDPVGAVPDVMRGEEIQIAGALLAKRDWRERCRAVLPGTHSKWVEVEAGKIVRISTYMTGELFAVLTGHSILGRLMRPPPTTDEAAASAAFARGVRAAAADPAALSHSLFSVRSLGLTGRLAPEHLADYLSGLLIGHEIAAALTETRAALPLLLIGEGRLCRRYIEALRLIGADVTATLDNTAPAGLHDFARAAGLIAGMEIADV